MKDKIVLIIDDGHGINTPGKRSPLFQEAVTISKRTYYKGDFVKENEINSAIGDEVKRLGRLYQLKAVEFLAPEHTDIPLSQRIGREIEFRRAAKAVGCIPVLVSVHANAHDPSQKGFLEWTNANGFETFYSPTKGPDDFMFAKIVHKHVLKASGNRDRGLKSSPNFYMVRESKSPAALIECGFMTNMHELKTMLTEEYQSKVAESIILAAIEYAEKRYANGVIDKED